MSIEPGGTIGPYTIDREIGRGGMGVVYLGHDTRLDRPVAIKSLPEHLAQDPERLARFEREARTLASLNHPNVAGIHGIEEHEGARYLILEFVEGQELAQLLDHGPLPPDEAVGIALQIAAGVEAAHEAGVVHRDLKPANIKITPDGEVKVLDFGLARAEENQSSTGMSEAATITSPAIQHSPTMPGIILGTAAYMSPEQARGRRVDRRTDIWSFGVVLYEMLTGIGPFRGETVTDSIGAILHKDIDLNAIPPKTPSNIRHVIERCIVRDKTQRLQSIGDARIDLARASDEPEQHSAAPSSPVRWAIVALLVLLAGAAGVIVQRALTPDPSTEGPLHVAIPIGVNENIDSHGSFALSPATRMVAYVASYPEGDSDDAPTAIYLRDFDSREPRKLAGTDHAGVLSFSPDGSQIAFTWFDPASDNEEVRRVSVDGGPVLTVFVDRGGDVYNLGNAPHWISEDEILAFSQDSTIMYKAPVAGGEPVEFVRFEEESEFVFNWGPAALDERSVFLNRGRLSTIAYIPTLFRMDLETGKLTELLEYADSPHLLNDGRLLFVRDDTLCMTRYDAETGTVTGGVTPLVSGLLVRSRISVSPRGDLCFVRGVRKKTLNRLMTIDRSGRSEPLIEAERNFNGTISVSDDGEQIALCVMTPDGPPQAHTVDVGTGFIRPVYPQARVSIPEGWAPDGRLAFVHWHKPNHNELELIDPLIGSSAMAPYPEPDRLGEQDAATFTPDGRYMVFAYGVLDEREGGIYAVDLQATEEDRAPFPVIATSADEGRPAISPDGKWLAYSTDASGKIQVMLQPLDLENPGRRTRVYPVSFDGGYQPFWSRDGNELFYLEADPMKLMGVRIATDPALSISTPEIIIDAMHLRMKNGFGNRRIDVMPDGERFVYIEEASRGELPSHLDLTLNWLEELDTISK